jgi:hypothetical protein
MNASECIVRVYITGSCALPRVEQRTLRHINIANTYGKLSMYSGGRGIALWFVDAFRNLIPNLFLFTRAYYFCL